MDEPMTPPSSSPDQPPDCDAGKGTQFFLGQLSGTVYNLGEQVKGFNERLDKKEGTDRMRHTTQMREQRESNERIFDKIDAINEKVHPTPCPKLMATCADMGNAETDIKELNKAHGTLDKKVSNMKVSGKVTWTTLVKVALVLAFILTSVLIPTLFFIFRK